MRWRRCKHCGQDSQDLDFDTCPTCAMLTTGVWVDTPDGPGEIVAAKHSGGLVVTVRGLGDRLYRGNQLAIQADGRMPGEDDEPAPIAPAPPARALEPLITADRTTDCRPLPPDPDPLAKIRRALMARSFPAGLATAGPR